MQLPFEHVLPLLKQGCVAQRAENGPRIYIAVEDGKGQFMRIDEVHGDAAYRVSPEDLFATTWDVVDEAPTLAAVDVDETVVGRQAPPTLTDIVE